MSQTHKFRIIRYLLLLLALSSASGLILFALKENIQLYMTPSELLLQSPRSNKFVRLGGYVLRHSVRNDKSGVGLQFEITDFQHRIKVQYQGILPVLFREGKGVIVGGNWVHNHFIAQEVLAKHDENYRPPGLVKDRQGIR